VHIKLCDVKVHFTNDERLLILTPDVNSPSLQGPLIILGEGIYTLACLQMSSRNLASRASSSQTDEDYQRGYDDIISNKNLSLSPFIVNVDDIINQKSVMQFPIDGIKSYEAYKPKGNVENVLARYNRKR